MPDRAQRIYKQEFRFVLGGCRSETSSTSIPKEAEGRLKAAWALRRSVFRRCSVVRFGLAERRFGHFLHVFYVAMSVTECARADLDVDRHSVAEFDAADVKQQHERHHDGELCGCHGIGVGRKFPYAK
jgi:hypothetical protein